MIISRVLVGNPLHQDIVEKCHFASYQKYVTINLKCSRIYQVNDENFVGIKSCKANITWSMKVLLQQMFFFSPLDYYLFHPELIMIILRILLELKFVKANKTHEIWLSCCCNRLFFFFFLFNTIYSYIKDFYWNIQGSCQDLLSSVSYACRRISWFNFDTCFIILDAEMKCAHNSKLRD